MKRFLFLVLVLAMTSGFIFAVDPAFTGTFEYYNSFSFAEDDDGKKHAESGDDTTAKINLNGVVDEWSYVSMELKNSVMFILDSTTDFGADPLVATYNKKNIITLNKFTLTTDLMGALGINSPVGVVFEWGALNFEPAAYQNKAGLENSGLGAETGTYLGTKISLDIMGFAVLKAVLWPTTWLDPNSWTVGGKGDGNGISVALAHAAGAAELQIPGLLGMIDANIYYTSDINTAINELGITAGAVIGPIELGLGFELYLEGDSAYEALTYDPDKPDGSTDGQLILTAGYKLSSLLAVGLGFKMGSFYSYTDPAGVKSDLLAKNLAMSLNVGVTPLPGLSFFVSGNLNDFRSKEDATYITEAADPTKDPLNIGYEFAVAGELGAVTYTLGFATKSSWKAPDWTYADADVDKVLFFKIKAVY